MTSSSKLEERKDEPMTLTSATKNSISLAWHSVEIIDVTWSSSSLPQKQSTSSSSSSISSTTKIFPISPFHSISSRWLPSSTSSSSSSSSPTSSFYILSTSSPTLSPSSSSSSSSSSPKSMELRPKLTGYQITFQASGSNFIQMTRHLSPHLTSYVINNLHESTAYDVCLVAHFNVNYLSLSSSLSPKLYSSSPLSPALSFSSSLSSQPLPLSSPSSSKLPGFTRLPSMSNTTISCLQASTVTESFAMMIGSTLGAFLALAIVVSIVHLAKKQRKNRRNYFSHNSRFGIEYDNDELGLDEAILRVGDNVFFQVYRQKMSTMKMTTGSKLDELDVPDGAMVYNEGVDDSQDYVVVSLDDVRSGRVGYMESYGGLDEDEHEERLDGEYGHVDEEHPRRGIEPRGSNQMDLKTIVENAYMLKL